MKQVIKEYIESMRNFKDFDYKTEEVKIDNKDFIKLKLIFNSNSSCGRIIEETFFINNFYIKEVIEFLEHTKAEIKCFLIKDLFMFCYYNYDIKLFKKILNCNKENECTSISFLKYNEYDILDYIEVEPLYIERYIEENIDFINKINNIKDF